MCKQSKLEIILFNLQLFLFQFNTIIQRRNVQTYYIIEMNKLYFEYNNVNQTIRNYYITFIAGDYSLVLVPRIQSI